MHKRISSIFTTLLLVLLTAGFSWAQDAGDRAAIDRLHQQDVEATITDDADQLAKLWDEDAVRLQSGSAPEVGKSTIYQDDKKWQSNRKGGHTLAYKPEIKDLKISGGWAFEWGTFELKYRMWQGGKEKTLRGKMLRVLKKQSDGSWKFARVMAAVDSEKG
jgi:ketosteroid isomerase-like protein